MKVLAFGVSLRTRLTLWYGALLALTLLAFSGILLADYLKQIMLGPTLPGGTPNQTLPPDLAQQAQGSKYFAQYCPGGTRWLCRPNDLMDTDLTFAFERG